MNDTTTEMMEKLNFHLSNTAVLIAELKKRGVVIQAGTLTPRKQALVLFYGSRQTLKEQVRPTP